jgi:hypothetical protein
VVELLFGAGVQLPVKPLREVVGSGVIVAPEHTAANGLKVGVTGEFTVSVTVEVPVHPVPGTVPVTV